MDQAVALARDNHSTDLVVLRGGEVVVDEWWDPDEAAAGVVVERLADGRVTQDVASTQKSVTSVLVGIAVGAGLVARHDTVSHHLGDGWTGTAAPEVERAITVDHLLTMTSGLGDDMTVVAPPGEWWDYNLGAAYHTLKRVLEVVAGRSIQELTAEWLTAPLGLQDTTWVARRWDDRLPARFRHSFEYPDGRPIEGLVTTARDLATFGRAVLRDELPLDPTYRDEMVRPSQSRNPSYGLLWWLNGGPFFLPPKVATPVEGRFLPDVPADAFAAMGANDRLCVIVPSLDLVVARCGASAGEPGAAGSRFGRQLVAAVVSALSA